MENRIKLYNGDCLERLKLIEDKSISLAIYDPPYFSTGIESVGDKQWKNEEEYINWCIEVIKETQRVLKDNGSFYWFHNDPDLMTDILYRTKYETNFNLKNQITWNKFSTHNNFSRVVKTYGDNRRYGKTFVEYAYYFTFQDETGLSTIQDDRELFKSLRDYFWGERQKIKHISYKDINEKIGFATNGGGVASMILNSKKVGWRFPSEDTYNKFKILGVCQRPYEQLRQEYENLRKEYESLRQEYEYSRFPFNQPYVEFKGTTIEQQKEILKPFSTIWEYPRDEEVYKTHMTPKPLEMIKHIIRVSSRPGDIILDCVMGSGTTGVATIEVGEGRKFIGIEASETHFNNAQDRINKALEETTYKNCI